MKRGREEEEEEEEEEKENNITIHYITLHYLRYDERGAAFVWLPQLERAREARGAREERERAYITCLVTFQTVGRDARDAGERRGIESAPMSYFLVTFDTVRRDATPQWNRTNDVPIA